MHRSDEVGGVSFAGTVRDILAGALLGVWCRPCAGASAGISDTRGRTMNRQCVRYSASASPKTFPFSRHFTSWDTYPLAVAKEAHTHVLRRAKVSSLSAIRWESFEPPLMRHPLSARFPYLADLLDIEIKPQPWRVLGACRKRACGRRQSVRGATGGKQARMQAPGGQSGVSVLATLLRPASQLARRSILAVRVQCHGFDSRHALRNGICAMILAIPRKSTFSGFLFFALDGFVNARLYLKLEGFHLTGSIKIETALFLMDDLEARGLGDP